MMMIDIGTGLAKMILIEGDKNKEFMSLNNIIIEDPKDQCLLQQDPDFPNIKKEDIFKILTHTKLEETNLESTKETQREDLLKKIDIGGMKKNTLHHNFLQFGMIEVTNDIIMKKNLVSYNTKEDRDTIMKVITDSISPEDMIKKRRGGIKKDMTMITEKAETIKEMTDI
jgi:hypothetical protein